MSPAPLVGIVIPTHNGARYVAEAIESALGQTHEPVDVVVVDDGSSDATLEVARRYAPAVRCLALPRRGLGAIRNAGVREVRGDYVAFLDQDDLWPPEKLELQLSCFRGDPELDLVFGGVREFLSPELDPRLAARVRRVTEARPGALPGTMLATRAAMARVGPFPTRWRTNDFMAWLLAARALGVRERMLAEHVLSRRIHDTNASHRAGATRSEYLQVLKESLDRRRNGAP